MRPSGSRERRDRYDRRSRACRVGKNRELHDSGRLGHHLGQALSPKFACGQRVPIGSRTPHRIIAKETLAGILRAADMTADGTRSP